MPSVHIDNVGEMAIIECAGRFVRSEAAFIMMRHRPLRLRPTVGRCYGPEPSRPQRLY
jgi:hypothetical protein